MTTNKMNLIELTAHGGADVLRMVERPLPDLTPGEVRIKVDAAGVNFSDVQRRENRYYMPTPLPFTPGAEVVGEVVEVGEGVGQPLGTRVLAMLPGGGGYAEFVSVPSHFCIPLPPSIPSKVAPALFVQGSTAHLMISQLAGSLAGKTVLIHAAAGGVGSLLVQLAKLEGATVIATASTEEKLQAAKELGADVQVNYCKENWVEDLRKKTEGESVDVIFEMVGGNIFEQSFQVLKPMGRMITYGRVGEKSGIVESETLLNAGHSVLGFHLGYHIEHKMDVFQASLGAMIGLLAEGKLNVLQTHSYDLKDAAQAHLDLENRKTTGKIILIP